MRRPSRQLLVLGAGGLIAAGLTWLGWALAGDSDWRPALAVLVVASPIGLWMGQRLPLWMGRRWRRGFEVTAWQGELVGASPVMRQLVIDVGGTVTTGQLVVTNVHAFDPGHDRNLRWFAGALSHCSADPVSRAIARLAGVGRTTGFTQDAEHGILGAVDRHPVRVGDPKWLGMEAFNGVGTTVGVEVDHRPMGHITVADEVRRDAAAHLDELRGEGVVPVLVSAGSDEELSRVAGLAKVEDWYAEADAAAVADKLDLSRSRTGWVRLRPNGANDAHIIDMVWPRVDGSGRGEPSRELASRVEVDGASDGEDTLLQVRTSAPSMATVVAMVRLVAQVRRARFVATGLAWAAVGVLVPLAAAGLVPPLVALASAAAGWVVVATSVWWTLASVEAASG